MLRKSVEHPTNVATEQIFSRYLMRLLLKGYLSLPHVPAIMHIQEIIFLVLDVC